MEVKSVDTQLLNLVKESKSVALLTHSKASSDEVSGMLAFYHTFKKIGPKIRIVVPETVPLVCHSIPESSIIVNDLGPKNLVISLDTKGSALSKISYYQESSTFNLVIHPKDRSFEVENIKYSYEGDRFDLFIIFGVRKISDLGEIYSKNSSEFSGSNVVNLDFHYDNEKYGALNIIDTEASSISELIFKRLLSWGVYPSREAAIALLTGLTLKEVTASTDNILNKNDYKATLNEAFLAKSNGVLIQ